MKAIWFLILGLLVTVQAQVLLPHRHGITVPPVAADAFTTDCGSPPVWSNLIQWICARAQTGATHGQQFQTVADISPVHTNGIWFTNLFANSIPLRYQTSSYPYFLVGLTIPTERSSYMQSNAWWTGLTEAHLFMVVQLITNISDQGLNQITANSGPECLWCPNSYGNDNPHLNWGSTSMHTWSSNSFHAASAPFFVLSMWTKANDWGCRSNSTQLNATTANTVGWPAGLAAGQALELAWAGGGYPLMGSLGEFLVYSNKLSDVDSDSVINWLRGKYGF